jgi:hypothetical protein
MMSAKFDLRSLLSSYRSMAPERKRFMLIFRAPDIGWRLLTWSGIWFIPSGTVSIWMSWQPTPGPYIIGERYAYGTLVEAWQISLGFSWVAFGLLFVGMALTGERLKSRWLWLSLLMSTMLVMFPHIWLGVMMVLEEPSLRDFGPWLIALPFGFLWVLAMGLGFVLASKFFSDVTRNTPPDPEETSQPVE